MGLLVNGALIIENVENCDLVVAILKTIYKKEVVGLYRQTGVVVLKN